MKVLVIGAGGREHALVWALSRSQKVNKIFAAPGNSGMANRAEAVPIAANKTVELADFAVSQGIGLTVVGPEQPLVNGLVDYFNERKLPVFGPSKAAARLEGSKVFAKEILRKAGVPTAACHVFKQLDPALRFIEKSPLPVVVKADGLAAGKGAVVAQTREEAAQALNSMLLERIFGDAGGQVVIEEFLQGEEVSILALVDGKNFVLLEPSQDHKRAYDNDQGPNTGGMGAYSPVPMVTPSQLEEMRAKVFRPVVDAMAAAGTPFKGVLYAGMMLTAEGPKVLEFNVRFGDPEAQALLPRLRTDLADLMMASIEGRLDKVQIAWDPRYSACVVLCSQGYPGKYDMGRDITGLEDAMEMPETVIFQAGTKKELGRVITVGGRVVNVVGLGETLEGALERAYAAAAKINFQGKQFRRDIGHRALRHLSQGAELA